jgi:hypothetical protein
MTALLIMALSTFTSCRAKSFLTVTEACEGHCFDEATCNSITFDHDQDTHQLNGHIVFKGESCCSFEGGTTCEAKSHDGFEQLACITNSTLPPGGPCLGNPAVTTALTYFAVAGAIVVGQVAVSTAASAGSSAASSGSSAASGGSSAPKADPSSVAPFVSDLATSSQGSGGLSLDSVDIEMILDMDSDEGDDDACLTVKPDSVGRCRLVIDNPFPEEEGTVRSPEMYKPTFVLPMPYSVATSGKKLARLPKPVGACCKRRFLPQKPLTALSLPAGDEDLWSKVAQEATRRYQGTPKRNDRKRLTIIRVLALISKLTNVLAGQGIVGILLKIISGSPIDAPLIAMLVLALLAYASGKWSEKLRGENYEESQKAVEDYVTKELTEELAEQGLHCLYAMENRRSFTFSLSPKKLCGIASTISSPVIFIDSKPLEKDDLASDADKFFDFAEKAKQVAEMVSKA